MPVSDGVEHREAPERLPDAARTPWELRISRRSVGFRTGQTPWDAGSTRRGLRVTALAQTPRAQACEGKSGSESSCDGPEMMCSEGGLKTLEPCTWNQVGRAQASSRPWSFRTSYSSEFEAAEHHGRQDAAGAAMRHGLPVRKSLMGENPKSGSGPSVSARPEGDQTVEGARNPEDGRCRARQARDNDPSADVAEGA